MEPNGEIGVFDFVSRSGHSISLRKGSLTSAMNDNPDDIWLDRSITEKVSRDAARISANIEDRDGGNDPFVAAVRATRMPMIVTNPRMADNPVVFANNAFCRLTGYAREEILGRNCRFLQGPETDPETIVRIRKAVQASRSIEVDIRNHRKDGTPFWNRLLMAPVHDAEGKLAFFFASQVDVTIERERLAGLETQNTALMAEVAGRLHAQREGEDRLRFAATAGRLGIWELDLRTRELTASSVCKENFGRDGSASLTYDELQSAVHPDDRATMQAAIEHSIETGAEYDIEYRIVRPDGGLGWIQVRAQVVRAADGSALRMAGISLDVTDRKETEARRLALIEIGDRLRDLSDVADIAFTAAGIMGRVLRASRAGYGTVDPVAETISIERDWNAPGVASLAGVLNFRTYGTYIDDLKRGELVAIDDAETDPRTAETAQALVEISARAVLNLPLTEDGRFVALLYVNHAGPRAWSPDEVDFVRQVGDRTRSAIERRRAENALRHLASSLEVQIAERTGELTRSEAKFKAYFRASPEYLFLLRITADDEIVYEDLNPAAERLYGLDRASVIGRRTIDLVDPDTVATVDRHARECAQTGRTGAYETVRTFGDASPLVLNVVVAPLGVNEKGDQLVLFCGRDLTEQRRAEEQLRQSQKMEAVGQLTGGIAHDFNNLLTGIGGSLDILQTRLVQGRFKDLDRYIGAAQGASKRAAALTHRLLAFSRRQTLTPKSVDVNRLVADLEDLIRRTVGPEIEVEVVGSAGLWPALVDPNQLENALLNLCINARDAMPDGGRLTIETSNRWLDERSARERDIAPGQYMSLSVSDTGTGMTPEVIARAFDPFFTTKPIGMGTGLGLSMIYGFARQSEGHVRIYSEVGHGTMVSIYLPRNYGSDEGEKPPAERPWMSERVGQGETVLVVDDEPTVRMLASEILEELGYMAIEAADGATGLKFLQSDIRIDLLITDVGLPGGMNGRQVADAGRALRPGLRVLFITGYAENAALGNGHLDPGMQVLTKPFAMEDLAGRIKALLASIPTL